MSFGHGLSAKTHDYRAIPLFLGRASESKVQAIAELRDKYFECLTEFAERAFTPHPLTGAASKEQLTAKLLPTQRAITGLNEAAGCCDPTAAGA